MWLRYAAGNWRRAGHTALSSVMGDLVTARRGPLLVALVMAVLVLTPVLAIGGVSNAFSWPLAATMCSRR